MKKVIIFFASFIFLFYLCKLKRKRAKLPLNTTSEHMKDRIRQVMDSKGMNQLEFAKFIQVSPSALSNIFNDRTKPSINIVEAIKKKIPDISIDWLLLGIGQMYNATSEPSSTTPSASPALPNDHEVRQDPVLSFDFESSPTSEITSTQSQSFNSVRNTRQNSVREEIKIVDKQIRRITEIRVFYDDQTWESFTPSTK